MTDLLYVPGGPIPWDESSTPAPTPVGGLDILDILTLWPPFGSPRINHPDLVAAVIARLRSYASGSVAAAFGDTGEVVKFFSDKATGRPDLPHIVIGEPGGFREYQSGGHYIDNGELNVSVLAAGKREARRLSGLVAAALDDAPLVFDDGELMVFRAKADQFNATPDVGVGVPTAYHRVVTFGYRVRGQI